MVCNTTRPSRIGERHTEARFPRPRSWAVFGCPPVASLLSCLLLVCSGLLGSSLGAASPKVKVLTSFLPAYCFTANVARDLAEVENLLPQASSPHDFQLSPPELRKLQTARLLVVNGLGLESWLPGTLEALGTKSRLAIVQLSSGLDEQLIFLPSPLKRGTEGASTTEEGPSASWKSRQGTANPHIWLDPLLAAHAVTNILRALQKADPVNADDYARNAREYVARLDRMDQQYRRAAKALSGSAFVTLHDAFPYLVRRYGLSLAGVIEPIPGVEPSARYFGRLLATARQNKVGVIFSEKGEASRLAGQLAGDTGARTALLDTLETGPLKPEAYEEGMLSNLFIFQEQLR